MKTLFRTAVAVAALAIGAHASAQITFYEADNFQGRSFTTTRQIKNFERFGFNDRASSVLVTRQRWEVCDDVRYSGRCVILRPGQYPSLRAMGLNDRVSSVRPIKRNAHIDDYRYAPAWTPPPQPAPAQVYDARPRNDERLFEVNVTSVRAIVGPPEQRCWIEREQVAQEHRESNVPGALAGALIGGILGHQVGDGRGKDLATVGGAIAGGAIGAQVGRDDQRQTRTQDVQRCKTVPNRAKPTMWDVSYDFRGQEHRVQMTAPPGPTIRVNHEGEPRQ